MTDYKPIARENATELVICPICSAVVFDRTEARDHHLAWHAAQDAYARAQR
jgi:hypothetical protein